MILAVMDSYYSSEDGSCTFEEMLATNGREIKSKLLGFIGLFRNRVTRKKEDVLRALKPLIEDGTNMDEALNYVAENGIPLPKGKTLRVDYADSSGDRYRIYVS